MLSPDDLRRLFRDAADQQRRLTSADWLAWLGDHGDRLMEGMGAWLDLVRGGDLPWHAGETTKAMLTLWAAPGLVKRPDVVQVAACFAATCPAELGRDFNYGDEVPNALGRLLRARAGVPDLPVQILLWQASLRADLGWGARLVCARFAFPHNAADLRDRLLNTDFHDDAALAHQSWLLRFADHPEFNATWGALFESADYAERRALLDAVQGDAERAAVLRALAWLVTRRPLGPADAIAGFAGAVGVPAAGVFLTWYAEHGPARGVPNALAGLQRWHGDAVQAVLDRVASAARDRAD
ncbi:MAG: hypothetical protein KC613_18090, partial [Myxococcales bacterium]|nr:hypothetical protein [Myxococcales bacterium]